MIRPPYPYRFASPFSNSPHPLARAAAEELMLQVKKYMTAHPESELHRRGKMFGVLVCSQGMKKNEHTGIVVLNAFSAMLDGSYHHEGFVPPVFEAVDVIGTNKEDSREKQHWLFHQYRFLNALGETKDLIDIFHDVAPVMTEEDYFSGKKRAENTGTHVPSGAGECCLPKLMQHAYTKGLTPLCSAEFWIGASPKDELRIEGQFYPACSGKCRPILAHTLRGLDVEEEPERAQGRSYAEKARTLYEDDTLIVVSKPAGLLSVPGKDGQYSLLEYLQEKDRSITLRPVHRLDMDTGGIIVYAKSDAVAVQLQQLFLRRDIHKVYLAELERMPERDAIGTIRLPLLPNPLDRPRQMVNHEHGKIAITHYEITPLCGPHGGPIIQLRPETGRTHQLRVHCAHPDGLAVPIYGDRLYGTTCGDRLMLHAAELRFQHPITGQLMVIKDDFL